jgi:hypothetical protein
MQSFEFPNIPPEINAEINKYLSCLKCGKFVNWTNLYCEKCGEWDRRRKKLRSRFWMRVLPGFSAFNHYFNKNKFISAENISVKKKIKMIEYCSFWGDMDQYICYTCGSIREEFHADECPDYNNYRIGCGYERDEEEQLYWVEDH